MISDSIMGREKRQVSSRDLIFMSLTRWPSLVTWIHSCPRPGLLELHGPALTIAMAPATDATAKDSVEASSASHGGRSEALPQPQGHSPFSIFLEKNLEAMI